MTEQDAATIPDQMDHQETAFMVCDIIVFCRFPRSEFHRKTVLCGLCPLLRFKASRPGINDAGHQWNGQQESGDDVTTDSDGTWCVFVF